MIYIIIPNFNGLAHLELCYDSLRKQSYKEFRIVLVDNNSSDDSVKFTEEKYPEVKILKLDFNTGFSVAVNEGIKYSIGNPDCKYILLLNNDTECDEFFLHELQNGFKDKNTGSVACKMLNFYDRNIIDDAGDFIKRKGSPYARGFGETDTGQYDKEEFIFGACAGAAIYKREVFEKIGYFDEDFFAYYEDVDFSFRMQLSGYKCFYNPKAICFHKRGATTSSKSGFQTMLCEKNLIAIRIKNYPTSTLIKWFPYFFLIRFVRYYRFYRDHSAELFRSAVKGYFKGISEIPGSLRKRKNIERLKTVSTEYIESLFK